MFKYPELLPWRRTLYLSCDIVSKEGAGFFNEWVNDNECLKTCHMHFKLYFLYRGHSMPLTRITIRYVPFSGLPDCRLLARISPSLALTIAGQTRLTLQKVAAPWRPQLSMLAPADPALSRPPCPLKWNLERKGPRCERSAENEAQLSPCTDIRALMAFLWSMDPV